MEPRVFGKELTNLIPSQNASKGHPSESQQPLKDELAPTLGGQSQAHQLLQKNTVTDNKISELKAPSSDPQLVPEYFISNLAFLRRQQQSLVKIGNYLPLHKTVSEQERAKLIDWLTKLHYKFKMFPETLFAIVSFIDQYLRIKEVPLAELQLVGIASLFIAAKFEETYQVPPLKQLISCCAFQYSSSQILEMEADIVKELKFNLIVNSTFRFFEPYCEAIGLEPKNIHLAHYILQLSLLQGRFLNYAPSLLAASAIYLVKKIRKGQAPWKTQMNTLVAYEEKELKICAKELCTLLEGAPQMEHTRAMKEKFSQPKFHEVTRIKLERKDKK